MDALQTFAQHIEALLAASRELPIGSGADFERSMGRFAERLHEFDALGRHVMVGVVRPRMEKLVEYFPGAMISKPGDPYQSTCWFGSTEHLPTMAILQIGIDHDERLEKLDLSYDLKVVPAFLPYERHDKLAFDLVPGRVDAVWRTAGSGERIDEQAVSAWVEDCLLRFVRTYLRLQACGSPQHGDATIDPICGMKIGRADAKSVREYKGHRYYFCSEECGRLFAAEPERFAKVEID